MRALTTYSLANLDAVPCPLVPSLPQLWHYIRSWRQRKNQVPPIPQKRNGYLISDEYEFLEKVLLFDSGEHDAGRMLFGTESGLDDLGKYKHWACDGTLKCSPDMHYQFYTLHILTRNSSIPPLFVLPPGKYEKTFKQTF